MGSLAQSDFTILTPCAILGYGFRSDHFWLGVDKYRPSAIIVDAGSTDGGPYKLGLNKMTCGRESYIRDLRPMLQACYYRKVKVLISSAGGDGSNAHVAEMLEIIREIATTEKFTFKVATITTDLDHETIKAKLKKAQIHPCGPVPDLTINDIDNAIEIVGQMGAEPFLSALQNDPDIILSGRSYDPAPFAAFCLHQGVDPGVAWYLGKIMECGAFCALPKGRIMVGRVRQSSFDLTPVSPFERCTPVSVAAHTLYEKTRPDRLPGPGGVLNLDRVHYEALEDGRTVRVSGARFEPSVTYQVKLEGVEKLGHRTIFIGGIRDPILISQIDEFLETARAYTRKLFPELDRDPSCQLKFQVYGKNAVMGPLEPNNHQAPAAVPYEVGILGEVVAPTQEKSHAVANNVRASILHMPYRNQMATAGNFASPLSPHEQDAGAVFRWNVYHLMDLQRGEELALFPVTHLTIAGSGSVVSEPESTHYSAEELEEFVKGRPEPVLPKAVPSDEAVRMMDIAKIVRSKNAGPFELTLDIMFDSWEAYQRVKEANVLTNDVICKLYRVQDDDILTNMYFDPAMAWKTTIRRPWEQGSIGERDTLGTQQYAPLLYIMVPPRDKTQLE
ncbi:hypothetical protein PV08_10519 [Exophiala spinifera]|uniref:Caib baif family enzyme n=1 Tax=Exophiala spinifera TaxID=91928 RepID=A0A0D2BIM5_9EURO|nr:uncharacterized protein PV08_10519 [Exophiala spinifera]KIW11219.1 hypothetical protein PV08_10519 [Exophiala spinifera]